jgi:hypothetical protein
MGENHKRVEAFGLDAWVQPDIVAADIGDGPNPVSQRSRVREQHRIKRPYDKSGRQRIFARMQAGRIVLFMHIQHRRPRGRT